MARGNGFVWSNAIKWCWWWGLVEVKLVRGGVMTPWGSQPGHDISGRKLNNRPDPTPILRQCDRVSLWKEAQIFSLHEGPGATPTESPRLLQPTITGQVDRSVTDRRVSEMRSCRGRHPRFLIRFASRCARGAATLALQLLLLYAVNE